MESESKSVFSEIGVSLPQKSKANGLKINCYTVIKMQSDKKDEEARKSQHVLDSSHMVSQSANDISYGNFGRELSFMKQIIMFKKLKTIGIFD